jgi:transposase InsO family protein
MKSIAQKKRYLPHEISTRIHSVVTYRQTKDLEYVCRKYKISKASLMRWNKKYDETRESLTDKSHRPHSQHPKAHTEEELKWIRDYHRRNPQISICELYGKLRTEKAYSRHPLSLYRVFVRLGYRKKPESTKKKSKHLQEYDTPKEIGVKWQMDVKYVPTACYTKGAEERFYQYTMIDEASRERFIYPYKEQSGYSTVDFIKRAIRYFGYKPEIIQTDNGAEFTNFSNTERVHAMDVLCQELGITHKLIRPRTPWHNGKVERSHRNDQERFYNYLSFYSYEDLINQMKNWLYRSNRIPMAVLGWMSPYQKRQALLKGP